MEGLMRSTISFAIAAMLATAMAAGAQTTRTETKIKGGKDAHTVTYMGCVGSGTTATSYILQHPVAIGETTTVGTSGELQTETTYALIPERTVQLQPTLGHKVRVTGVMARGDVKQETKVKTDGEREVKTEQKIKGDNHIAQFHVVSVQDLN